MKIAIMTQPLGLNYGGIMQAWALQRVLRSMGAEPVTIDRQLGERSPIYRFAQLTYRILMTLIRRRRGAVWPERENAKVRIRNSQFVKKHMVMSDRFESAAALRMHFLRGEYDAVVVGSDQTWRPSYSPDIFNFYLDFLDGISINRVAYASSFGVDVWEYTEQQTSRCRELAEKFDEISVRERSGVVLCRDFLKVDAVAVLDPTLLLNSEEYIELFRGAQGAGEASGGLFSYMLDDNPEKQKAVAWASSYLGISPFSVGRDGRVAPATEGEAWTSPGVEDWIRAFYDAEFVLTDSFHGCAFSLAFRKPFLVFVNEGRGASRFTSLLGEFGLEDRLVFNHEDFEKKLQGDDIDWARVDEILSKRRIDSLSFLRRALLLDVGVTGLDEALSESLI